MGGRGSSSSGGSGGSGGSIGGTIEPPDDPTGYDAIYNPEDIDAKPPYVSSKPPTLKPALPPGEDLTRAEKSWIEAFYDGAVGLTTDAIEAVVNKLTEPLPPDHPLQQLNLLLHREAAGETVSTAEKNAIHDAYGEYCANLAMSFGPAALNTVISKAEQAIAKALITKADSPTLTKLNWREAYDLLQTTAAKAGDELQAIAERWALKSEAALSRLNIPQLETELTRVGNLANKSDITAKYETTLLEMIKRERLIDLGKTPKSNPNLPPSTYRNPEPSIEPITARINTPPATPETNTAAAITGKEPSLTAGGINVAGSRSIAPEDLNQVERIATALQKAGCAITTGCAKGTDEVFAKVATKINAQFGPNGDGAFSSSNVVGVKAAEQRGATVEYYAGGDLTTPLKQRLFNRSAVTATDHPTTFGIFTQEASVGTTNTLKTAVQANKNVFALSTNNRPLPSLGDGHWQAVDGAKGIWAGLHRWVRHP
ncbi:MAG: DNA-processing protein DprA [Verrucomicrobia subdivision 3 bacterium]|nr:DNA-processing protein DprA [Limisphaerales bacterium]